MAPASALLPASRSVRFATLNIKSAGGSWGGKARADILDDLATFLCEQEVDVAVLQEVDRCTGRSRGVDELGALAQATQASDAFFARARGHRGGDFGVGILCRNGFTLERGEAGPTAVALPRLGAVETRTALRAEVRGPHGEAWTTLTPHLSLSPRVSTRQLERVATLARAEQDRGHEVVLAGDFNLGPREVRPRLVPAGLVDAFERVHGPGAQPPKTALLSTPDHLAVSPGIHVNTVEVLEPQRHGKPQGLWERLSDCVLREKVTDHKAVLAQLEVPVINERSP